MYRHRRCALIFAVASVAAASSAEAQDVERVGIVVSLTVNVSRDDANQISDDLADALEKELYVDVISGAETERRLPTGGLDEECIAKPACLKDLGARLEAQQLLMLVVLKVGEALQIDTTWVDANSNKTIPRDAIRLEGGTERELVFRRAAPGLLPGVARRPPELVEGPPKGEDGDTTVEVVATPERDLTPVFAAGGVGAALLIGGVVAGVSASADQSALEDDMCDRMVCDPSRVDAMETKALVADLLYTGALVSAGVAVVLFVLTGDEAAEPSVEVAPTRDGVRATWGVRF